MFVLLTPRTFQRTPQARLYGWLMHDYNEHPEALARDLAHRQPSDWADLSGRQGV